MRQLTNDKMQAIIDNYINGNKSDFYKAVDKMSKLDIVNLIARMQPYHSTIAKLQNHFEGVNRF